MADSIRLDKFLWFARIVKTRAIAQAMAESGHIRRNGQPVERASAAVRVGDVLTFAHRGAVRVLKIAALPARRGPPAEARSLYSEDEVLARSAGLASAPIASDSSVRP